MQLTDEGAATTAADPEAAGVAGARAPAPLGARGLPRVSLRVGQMACDRPQWLCRSLPTAAPLHPLPFLPVTSPT
jgi:hypothetical protein